MRCACFKGRFYFFWETLSLPALSALSAFSLSLSLSLSLSVCVCVCLKTCCDGCNNNTQTCVWMGA